MAGKTQVTIRPGHGTIDEKGDQLLQGQTREVSPEFAASLVRRQKAVEGKEKFDILERRPAASAGVGAADKRIASLERQLAERDDAVASLEKRLKALEKAGSKK